jgi:hypothetical protein
MKYIIDLPFRVNCCDDCPFYFCNYSFEKCMYPMGLGAYNDILHRNSKPEWCRLKEAHLTENH